jgi:hypothetical protein
LAKEQKKSDRSRFFGEANNLLLNKSQAGNKIIIIDFN